MKKICSCTKFYGGEKMFERSYYGGVSNAGAIGVCFLVAIIGGILLYFLFLTPKNDKKFTGFMGWLYDFLAFKKLLVEAILKVIYLISACFITLLGIVSLFDSFVLGIAIIVLWNIILRISYEFLLVLIIICKNTSEINKKISGKDTSEADMFVSQVEIPKSVVEQFTAKTSPTTTAEPEVFCKSCGQKMKIDSTFCPNCGQKNE